VASATWAGCAPGQRVIQFMGTPNSGERRASRASSPDLGCRSRKRRRYRSTCRSAVSGRSVAPRTSCRGGHAVGRRRGARRREDAAAPAKSRARPLTEGRPTTRRRSCGPKPHDRRLGRSRPLPVCEPAPREPELPRRRPARTLRAWRLRSGTRVPQGTGAGRVLHAVQLQVCGRSHRLSTRRPICDQSGRDDGSGAERGRAPAPDTADGVMAPVMAFLLPMCVALVACPAGRSATLAQDRVDGKRGDVVLIPSVHSLRRPSLYTT
jgi:hypothetical protein